MLRYIFLAFISIAITTYANTQITLQGNIKDATTKEPIIGASVFIAGSTTGCVSDYDGNYIFQIPENSNDTILFRYIGYKQLSIILDKSMTGVITKDIDLDVETHLIEGVIIVGKASRQSISGLTALQQQSPSMLTGISSDDIKKAPDRTTSDVLKRVSGASIQDNKFIVVRGLADRYNNALLNGNALPSSEPDKRAFSFDLFPSNMLANLVIYKTATPELPGEFAGGLVQINTKEVPETPFFTLSLGASHNSLSTFKPYQFYQTGNTDWLGFDNSKRVLPDGVTKEKLSAQATRIETSKRVSNDWNIQDFSNLAPSQSAQLSAGTSTNVLGRQFGVIAALSYNSVNRINTHNRADFNLDKSKIYDYTDNQFKKLYAHGAMLNAAYSLSQNHKLIFNNLLSIAGDDQFIYREGHDIEQTRFIKAYSMLYTSTSIRTHQLMGEHALTEGGLNLKWAGTYNDINRLTPSYRRMLYSKNEDAYPEDPYYAYVPFGAPSPNYAGRFYSDQKENLYGGKADLYIPISSANKRNCIKIGGTIELKDRAFDARVFGYTYASNNIAQEKLVLSIDSIFDHSNISENGFTLKESTNPNDSYHAESTLGAGYAMLEYFLFKDKLRVIGGLRAESYNQKLQAFEYGGKPINLDATNLDYLPSLNLVFANSEKSNIRLSVSKTIIRPNFRELAPFSFYDFNLAAAVVGNPDLKRTNILNLDLKYEFFFDKIQNISISAFYKDFKNPIEQIYETLGAGTKNFNFENGETAMNYGAELEFRHNLGPINRHLKDLTFTTNLAYINSEVNLENFAGQNNEKRPLQGQSPYVANAGLLYGNADIGLNAGILFNRIGRRIWLVGSNGYLDTYEAPRNTVDLQISKRFGKKTELKLSASDILDEEVVFYQDQNNSKRYEKENDTKIVGSRLGRNISISLTYNFK